MRLDPPVKELREHLKFTTYHIPLIPHAHNAALKMDFTCKYDLQVELHTLSIDGNLSKTFELMPNAMSDDCRGGTDWMQSCQWGR